MGKVLGKILVMMWGIQSLTLFPFITVVYSVHWFGDMGGLFSFFLGVPLWWSVAVVSVVSVFRK